MFTYVILAISFLSFPEISAQVTEGEGVQYVPKNGSCEESIMPPQVVAQNLFRDLLLERTREFLKESNGKSEMAADPEVFPLPFLEHMIGLLQSRDKDFEVIVQKAAEHGLKFWLFINAHVYRLLEMRPFMREESQENILIFLDGFKRAISQQAKKLKDLNLKISSTELELTSEVKVFMGSEFARWFELKRGRFQKIYVTVEGNPTLLQNPTEELYWAYSISRVMMTQESGREALKQLPTDDASQIETVSNWWSIPKHYMTETEPPQREYTRLGRILSSLGIIRREQPVTRQILAPNVGDLRAEDPVWLFDQIIPSSNTNLAGDPVGRSFANFERLVWFGFLMGDFNQDQSWWTRGVPIPGEKSRGMPRQFRGTDFRRSISWPIPKLGWGGAVFLDLMRVAQTETPDGRIAALEVLASRDGKTWHPFLFKRVGDFWVREFQVDGKSLEESCLKCHRSDGQGKVLKGLLSPRPLGFRAEDFGGGFRAEDFRRAGYPERLIPRLLEF